VERNIVNPYIVVKPRARAFDRGYYESKRCHGSGGIVEIAKKRTKECLDQ
jgi:hypothetical protein